MIEFGTTLRQAREAKGYDIGQLAETTHLAPNTIKELEAENFTRIAAPIYGRGFVKLYCEAVGLDPKPLVAEFMEIYNGNREPVIRERPDPVTEDLPHEASPMPLPAAPEPPPAEPASVREEVTAAEPPPKPNPPIPPSESRDLVLESDVIRQPPPAPAEIADVEPPPPPDPQPPAPQPSCAQEPSLSRYAAPVRQALPPAAPYAYLKLGILAVGALVLVALLLYGIRAVYRATTPLPTEKDGETVAERSATVPEKPAAVPEKPAAPAKQKAVPAKAAPAPKPGNAGAKRIPQKIPSLYID